MAPARRSNFKDPLICLCNAIPQSEVETAIEGGCHTLGEIFDRTTAGVGACGGSCQPTLTKMLETFRETGKFPDNPRGPAPRPRRKPLV